MVVMTAWEAAPGGEETMARLRATTEDEFLEGLEGDFIGVQTYTGMRVGPGGPIDPGADAERTQMGYPLPARGPRSHDPGERLRRPGLPIFATTAPNPIETARHELR